MSFISTFEKDTVTIDTMADAQSLLRWAMSAGWDDDRVVAACRLLLKTDAAIDSGKQYAEQGGTLS